MKSLSRRLRFLAFNWVTNLAALAVAVTLSLWWLLWGVIFLVLLLAVWAWWLMRAWRESWDSALAEHPSDWERPLDL